MIIETFEEKLHAKNMMHFRNLGLIFFQESMQMSASEFLQKNGFTSESFSQF